VNLKDLYREVILDHNRSPRNFGTLEPADAEAHGHNPLCGDRLHLTVRLQGDRLADVRFQGQGCAISVASASLMSEAVKGRSRAEVARLYEQVHALLTGRPVGAEDGAGAAPAGGSLGKLAALGGVAEFPARVKCASLCWHTLDAALRAAPAAPGQAAAAHPGEPHGAASGTAPATVSTE
jgi:nitrogen fixation protein NifU and related proteins